MKMILFLMAASLLAASDNKPLLSVSENKPPVYECFKVRSLERVDDLHYRQTSENTCPYTLRNVYIFVKFLDKDGYRIGVDEYGAAWVNPGEKLRTVLPAPEYVKGFKSVGVRKITSDSLDSW
jgi:hypothetical protein